MAYRIEWTGPAEAQFTEIVSIIRQDNPVAAEKFSRNVLSRIDSLGEHPRSGAVYKRRRGFEARQIVYRPYRIIYRVRPRLKRIEVLFFWHGARQEPRLG